MRQGTILLVGLALCLAGGIERASADSDGARQAIIDLMLCYGQGTDAIGDSTRADPEAEGAAIYARCFTDDARFRAWFPGADFDDPSQAVAFEGPADWAAFVFSVFDGTYTFTQHTLSNFHVKVRGRRGKLQAYLNAAHVKQEGGAVTLVDVAHGTYTLEVVRKRGRWKVKSLDLTLINFTPFFSAPTEDAPVEE